MDVSKVEQQLYVKIAHFCMAEMLVRVLPSYKNHWMTALSDCCTLGGGLQTWMHNNCWPAVQWTSRVAHTEVQVTVIEHCLRDKRRCTVAELSAHSISAFCGRTWRCTRFVQSGCHMCELRCKKGFDMRQAISIWSDSIMKEMTCWM